jgi:hypothetical protein
MSRTFDKVRALVQRAEVRISDHGYDEMSNENAREVLAGVFNAIVIEDDKSFAIPQTTWIGSWFRSFCRTSTHGPLA